MLFCRIPERSACLILEASPTLMGIAGGVGWWAAFFGVLSFLFWVAWSSHLDRWRSCIDLDPAHRAWIWSLIISLQHNDFSDCEGKVAPGCCCCFLFIQSLTMNYQKICKVKTRALVLCNNAFVWYQNCNSVTIPHIPIVYFLKFELLLQAVVNDRACVYSKLQSVQKLFLIVYLVLVCTPFCAVFAL